MRKIILEVPDGVMCIGVFVNYKTQKQLQDKDKPFTTTNFLINPEEYAGAIVGEDGRINNIVKGDEE